jgi:hypothetical protein
MGTILKQNSNCPSESDLFILAEGSVASEKQCEVNADLLLQN